jgi:MATE family multidrug resistance protein
VCLGNNWRGHCLINVLGSGQVIALFLVGLGEYGVVWLGTDWEQEVEKGVERNRVEAKRQAVHEQLPASPGLGP